MKIIFLKIIHWIAVIAANIAFLWVIIEFILYLVKDKVFNWWSVFGFIFSVVVALVCVIFALIIKSKARTKSINYGGVKSKFQKRIEDIKGKRNYK